MLSRLISAQTNLPGQNAEQFTICGKMLLSLSAGAKCCPVYQLGKPICHAQTNLPWQNAEQLTICGKMLLSLSAGAKCCSVYPLGQNAAQFINWANQFAMLKPICRGKMLSSLISAQTNLPCSSQFSILQSIYRESLLARPQEAMIQ
ncbi:hypothetical protein ACFFSY_25920 [Paenibacillus aurantiacus]|uniref:Uncharacterized protein n=1 Tax=Paenibacillus aurantiacus TaxID=1936118 RepID=A0ABV5KVZ7_9BACL